MTPLCWWHLCSREPAVLRDTYTSDTSKTYVFLDKRNTGDDNLSIDKVDKWETQSMINLFRKMTKIYQSRNINLAFNDPMKGLYAIEKDECTRGPPTKYLEFFTFLSTTHTQPLLTETFICQMIPYVR
ncbi:uncharacterized protein LOC143428803 [Xylocopa sonorina]|uniref:uncharacterized protein LOC143428803 n=1 Tax=Xylocopa sonorina TaxID=1818115 RepID=UPI00403A9AD0